MDWAPTLVALADGTPDAKFNTMTPGDGVAHAAALTTHAASPRTELLIAADNFGNNTAFISGNYKLMLGCVGMGNVVDEPVDEWVVPTSKREPLMIIAELVGPLMSAISIDSYLFEWAVQVTLGQLHDNVYGTGWSPIDRHPQGPMASMGERRNIVLPWVQWEAKDRVFLFNLETDPFETTNIAYENRDIVEQMAQRVRELVSTAPPQMGAIHFRFAQVGKNLRRAFAVLTTLVITILWWCCCRPRRKVSPAVTSTKKQH